MALSKIQPASMDLTANYAFTGTNSVAGTDYPEKKLATVTASSSSTLSFTSSIDNTILIKSNISYSIIMQKRSPSSIKANEEINIPAAGIGKPIKLCFCSVSKLNFANLIAPNIGNKKATKQIFILQ